MKLPWDTKTSGARAEGKYVRPRSAPIYNTWRWIKLSRAFRAEHPLCEECKRRGIIRSATCVDHIEPWPVCGEEKFYDRSNLQSLCDKCNNEKGQRDKKKIQEWKNKHKQSEYEERRPV